MKTLSLRWLAFLLVLTTCTARASADGQTPGTEGTQSAIAALLHEFLTRVDDPAMHQRFWANDLIYTTGQGQVRSKQEIVQDVAAAARASTRATPKTTYAAEDVRVRPYGNFAALNFRLLVRNPDGTTWYSRNSGAFLFRDGQWQVVTWQATREPEKSSP